MTVTSKVPEAMSFPLKLFRITNELEWVYLIQKVEVENISKY